MLGNGSDVDPPDGVLGSTGDRAQSIKKNPPETGGEAAAFSIASQRSRRMWSSPYAVRGGKPLALERAFTEVEGCHA